MDANEAIELIKEALYVLMKISAPVMLVALFVGLLIALFQALTQIQEMTLTFVPKLLAIVITFWMSMDFMTGSLVGFFQNEIIPIVARYH